MLGLEGSVLSFYCCRATASAVGQAAEGPSTAVQTPISSSELHYLWAPAVVAGMVAIMPSPAGAVQLA